MSSEKRIRYGYDSCFYNKAKSANTMTVLSTA